MSNVQVGPPDLTQADKSAVAVADFLRHNSQIQQRQGILNGKRQDFFRVKRAIRALESDAYKKAHKKNQLLPSINSRAEALEAFRQLPLNRLAFRVIKLDTEDAKKKGLKPVRGVPVLNIFPQQEFGDDMYYTWFYDPVQPITYLYAVLALAAIFAIVMFPLWPTKLRVGVWYLSMGLVVLLGVFFGIAIIRLILFCITYFVKSPGIWLFPNLFEDVGFVDSFKPLWGWQGVNCLPGADKKKSNKKRNMGYSKGEMDKLAASQAHQHQHQGQNQSQKQENLNPQQQAMAKLYQEKMQELNKRAQGRYEEIVKGSDAPKTPEEDKALKERLIQEEAGRIKQELVEATEKVRAAGESSGSSTGASAPVQRKVTLEEDEE